MLLQRGISPEVAALQNSLFEVRHLAEQPCGQDRHAHYLDQADILFFDMVALCVGMINAKRMLLSSDIIAEHQVELIVVTALSRDWSDRVVRRAVRERVDESVLIRISAPGVQYVVGQRDDAVRVRPAEPDAGHRPVHDTAGDVLKSLHREGPLHRRLGHGKIVVSALEMVVAQDRSAHDRQVRVGSQEVVRESLDKVKQLAERVVVDRHGNMAGVEHDAVLVVVNIRRILESPGISLDRDRDDPVVFSGRVVHSAKISLVLHAELALGIAALRRVPGRCDRLGVLLGLGEVDRDIQLAVLSLRLPPSVLFDPVSADVVRISRKVIIPVGSFEGILLVDPAELCDHLAGAGRHDPHDLRVEEISHHDTASVQHVLSGCKVEDLGEDPFQKRSVIDPGAVERCRPFNDLLLVPRIIINAERSYKRVDRIDHIFLLNKTCCKRILCQISYCLQNLLHLLYPLF